jgi:hypothetical protein
LATLFLSGDANVAARLARISARQNRRAGHVDESRNESNIARAAYRKLVFENVVSGRAATVHGDGGGKRSRSPSRRSARLLRASIAKGVDLAELARLALSARRGQ